MKCLHHRNAPTSDGKGLFDHRKKTGCGDLSGRAARRRSKLKKRREDESRQPRIRNAPQGEPYQTEHDRGGDENRQQIDADRILLDEHIPNQADIQIFVGTVSAKVKIRIAVLDQVNTGRGLVAIKTQMQMRTAGARHDQRSACQEK